MLHLKLRWVSILVLLYVCSAEAQFNGQIPEQYELEVGYGVAVLYDAQIQDAMNAGRSNLIYLTYYQPHSIFSLRGGYDFMTAFNIGDYQLSTDLIFLHLEAAYLLAENGRRDFSVFGFVGPTYQMNNLAVRQDDFLVGGTDEKVNGLGLSTGVGLRGRTANWVASVYGNLTFNSADFQAGSFEPVNYRTGAERVIFSIGYIIKKGRSETSNCPTYR